MAENSYYDSNFQVINSMSQAKMNSLKNSDGKIPELANQLIMTDEEDANLSQLRTKVLWTNPNPNGSDFNSQTISLNSGDYDFLMIVHSVYLSNEANRSSVIVPKGSAGRLTWIGASSNYDYSYEICARAFAPTSDTQIQFKDNFYSLKGGTASAYNSRNVPLAIYGIYKSPAMIYTGAELHEGDGIKINNGVISTATSEDSQVLLYSSSGVVSGTITLGDISSYKFITIATSDDNNFKTINVYGVKSLIYMINNNGFGIYGYSSNFINCSCSGSINNFSLNLMAYTNQKIIAIWGVK